MTTYTGTARNHPTARLRQLARTYEHHAAHLGLILGFGALLYLAMR